MLSHSVSPLPHSARPRSTAAYLPVQFVPDPSIPDILSSRITIVDLTLRLTRLAPTALVPLVKAPRTRLLALHSLEGTGISTLVLLGLAVFLLDPLLVAARSLTVHLSLLVVDMILALTVVRRKLGSTDVILLCSLVRRSV